MKCSKCGKEIANDSNFCEYCGTKIQKNIKEPTRIIQKKSYKIAWIITVIIIGYLLVLICAIGCIGFALFFDGKF